MARTTTKDRPKLATSTEGTIASNRAAGHNYELLDRYEAGIQLTGTEIKSIRQGKVNVREAYARIQSNEALLLNCHISQYQAGSWQNHEPTRPRRLLLHKDEIRRLQQAVDQRGLTVVPVRMYFKRGMVKVELALAKGRRAHDKRDAIATREANRQIARALKRSSL